MRTGLSRLAKGSLELDVFVECCDDIGQLSLKRELFACAGSSDLNVNRYKLREKGPLPFQTLGGGVVFNEFWPLPSKS
jgi:hypothetical protein